MPRLRRARNVVVCDGQSLNVLPGGTNGYPYKLQQLLDAELGEHTPFVVAGVGGQSWTNLLLSSQRATSHALDGSHTYWIGVGGTADIGTEGDTGAELYADNAAYSQAMTAAGFYRTIGTTTTPAEGFTAPQLSELATGNGLILDDALGAFNAVVDLAGTPGLDDPESIYYSDGVHWSTDGTTLAAETVLPVLLALIQD